MLTYALTALVLTLGASAVIQAKRRAHARWIAETGGVITGEAQGDPSKRGLVQGTARIASFGGNTGQHRLVDDANVTVRQGAATESGLIIRTSSGQSAIHLPEAGLVQLVTRPQTGHGNNVTVEVADGITLRYSNIMPLQHVILRGARLPVGAIVGYPSMGSVGPEAYGFGFTVASNVFVGLGRARRADAGVYLASRGYVV